MARYRKKPVDDNWLARDPIAFADFIEGFEDAQAGRVVRLNSIDDIDALFKTVPAHGT